MEEISIEKRLEFARLHGQWQALEAVRRKLQYKIWYNARKQKLCKDPYKFLALYTERKVLVKLIHSVDKMLRW